jgi:hypothetical protein
VSAEQLVLLGLGLLLLKVGTGLVIWNAVKADEAEGRVSPGWMREYFRKQAER